MSLDSGAAPPEVAAAESAADDPPAPAEGDAKDAGDVSSEIVDTKRHLNLVFIGHFAAGKSTIVGHMLFLSGLDDGRTIQKFEKEGQNESGESRCNAYITNRNEEGVDQGKTVEIGRAHFETEHTRFTILNAPGDESYVPNIMCGASQADICVLVISARKDEFETGYERGILPAKSSGLAKLVVLINKMDESSVKWSQERYNEIKENMTPFLKSAGYNVTKDVYFLPISGLEGTNMKTKMDKSICNWWDGACLFDLLDCIEIPSSDPKHPVSPSFHASEDEDQKLYFCQLRLQEVQNERDYLCCQLDDAMKQVAELKAKTRELLQESKKVQQLNAGHISDKTVSRYVRKKLRYCHNIFVCPNEVGTELLKKRLVPSDAELLLCSFKVPGPTSTNSFQRYDTLEKMTPFCKVGFMGMIETVYRLHRNGLSLSGNFRLKNFFWTCDRRVKFGASIKKHLSKRTHEKMKLDYLMLHRAMSEILKGIRIPADLEALLDLMNSDPVKHQVLIRYNLCLMDDISKREYIITLITQMEQLDKEDQDKFGKEYAQYRTEVVLSFIDMPVDWKNIMSNNKFVKQIVDTMFVDRPFADPYSKRVFVKFIRHCMVHLPEKAFDEEKETHYTDSNVVDLVQAHVPQVLSQLQRGMEEIKKLAYPHLIRIMKA